MKVLILLVFSCICYINVQAKAPKAAKALEIVTTVCIRALKCNLPRNSSLDVSGIVVYFFDFQNRVYESFRIGHAAQGILSIKNLNKKKNFYIYVGGFKSHIAKETTDKIKDAFKSIPNSYLIIVDHTAYTNDLGDAKSGYERSVKFVPSIGKKIARMLDALRKKSVSPKNIHCIGHSLGGQILGYVGENFKEISGQNISRITALDPAGPCFGDKSNNHIKSGVAKYVEIYHCNAGVLGSDKSLGDVNFIVDDGTYLTECGKPSSCLNLRKAWDAAKCSHKKCLMMWTASMLDKNRFPAYKCDKYKNFEECVQQCKNLWNDKTTAGFWNPGKATGTYCFSTNGYNLF